MEASHAPKLATERSFENAMTGFASCSGSAPMPKKPDSVSGVSAVFTGCTFAPKRGPRTTSTPLSRRSSAAVVAWLSEPPVSVGSSTMFESSKSNKASSIPASMPSACCRTRAFGCEKGNKTPARTISRPSICGGVYGPDGPSSVRSLRFSSSTPAVSVPSPSAPGTGSTRGLPVEIGPTGPGDWVAQPASAKNPAKKRIGRGERTRNVVGNVI